jgi:hypothetical protein
MKMRVWIAAATVLVVPALVMGQDTVPREYVGPLSHPEEFRWQSWQRERQPQVNTALRDVINEGADLFNLQADHAGCYRLYQGSLVALKPMLEPWQKRFVDKALTDAPTKTTSAEKAYCLREAIDRIRTEAAAPGEELLLAMPERGDVTSK